MTEQWFKVKVVYPVTKRPNGLELDSESEDRDPVLEKAGHYGDLTDDYEIENAYFNLVSDPIMHLMAGSFKPNDKSNKRNYTLIVFESGNTVTAIGKPDDVFEQLMKFMETFPKEAKD
jgi:hypothetical protein